MIMLNPAPPTSAPRRTTWIFACSLGSHGPGASALAVPGGAAGSTKPSELFLSLFLTGAGP